MTHHKKSNNQGAGASVPLEQHYAVLQTYQDKVIYLQNLVLELLSAQPQGAHLLILNQPCHAN